MARRGRVVWYGEKIKRQLAIGVQAKLNGMAKELQRRVIENISTPTAAAGPSSPGEFPNLDEGDLAGSIIMETGNWYVKVGTTLEHGIIHETGDRPFLRRTFEEERASLRAMFFRKWNFLPLFITKRFR